MGQALYRKYRPKTLGDIVGQKHITDTLSNAIKSGKISHAYLLTGPRGVGKTSVARILAHEVNAIPYSNEHIHLDIIEIDAASNRRIDEIRNLRDKVHILPTSAKYKVYIIDEVHMLTREAFNALLKTLEEPPEHAIFILATTEAHKLPETIISRTQHYSFKPIDSLTIVKHLKSIAKSEKINIDDVALDLIADHGDGSFRDSISLLDQARSISDHITENDIQRLLGIAPSSAIDNLITIIMQATPKELFDSLHNLRDQGLQSSIIAKQLGQKIRTMLLSDSSLQNVQTTQLLQSLLLVQASSQSDQLLEITLLEYMFMNNPTNAPKKVTANEKTNNTIDASVSSIPSVVPKTQKNIDDKTIKPKKHSEHKEKIEDTESPRNLSDKPISVNEEILEKEGFTEDAWPIIVAEVKKTNSTLYGILRMAQISLIDNTLTLQFRFAFHQKQINEAKNKKIIEDIIMEQTGDSIKIVCITLSSIKIESTDNKTLLSTDLDTVSNIFGGGEVIES